jgi:catechol 2,3-dioxygenase-like lactoylglutathione lyase family enzyme
MGIESLNAGAVIPVSDLAASRRFYESKLGLRGEPAPGGWALHAGG